MAFALLLVGVISLSLLITLVLLSITETDGQVRQLPQRRAAPSAESNQAKGERAEAEVQRQQLDPLPDPPYQSYQTLYLPKFKGRGTTEVDHVVVSPYGIFVIETKSWQGTIYGQPSDAKWVQQLGSATNIKENPIRQNLLHTRSVAKYLRVRHDVVRSVICFHGQNCSFGNPMPSNVIRAEDLGSYLTGFRQSVLSGSNVRRVNRILANHIERADPEVDRSNHLRWLTERRGTTQPPPTAAGRHP